MTKKLLLSSPHMSEEEFELSFVKEAFDSNWIAPLGPNVDGFESDLKEYLGVKNALALVSGTSAIHLALQLAKVGENDIVLCQSLTFAATANPITYQKATPVFIGSEPDTWNMDPEALEKALIKYPQAKAVIVVHLYGIPAKIDQIKEICDRYNVVLIEDAAESLGTVYKGKMTGTFGKYGILSFNGNKIITTSGGGMLVSDNSEDILLARKLSTQARENELHYEHTMIGYNYRMSNVCAGIGRGQMKVLDQRIQKKQEIYFEYKRLFSVNSNIEMMPYVEGTISNCWLTAITIKGKDPFELVRKLQENGIESRPIWKPMHLQPVFEKNDYIGNDFADELFKTGLCLPSDTKMTMEDVKRVTEEVLNFMQ